MADYLRRLDAAIYLQDKFGFGGGQTLAKLAGSGGGPEYHRVGKFVVYSVEALDAWALARLGPAVRSTSDANYPAKQA